MGRNVFFELLMTLTLTFDLDIPKLNDVYSDHRSGHVKSLKEIAVELWPVEGEQTNKQTKK
jgi:hypothetical protein